MKITLIVLGVIFCLLLLLLFLPLTVDINYENEFVLKIKYSGITFFDSEKRVNLKKSKKKKRQSKEYTEGTEESAPQKENFFKKTYKQKGLLGTVRYFSEILILLLKKIWWVIKRFKFRKFRLNLSVATYDAANTAINYGKICSAVYPVISFLETNADFKAKEININADFDKTDSRFQISTLVTTRVFFWLVAAIAALFEFLKLQRKESEKYERK
ncbi:MAG: DUF2953 domain-containing protein [Clostridia bacterium]|nr:DUF2953 domain-containing protein [Clostridia bacterium]